MAEGEKEGVDAKGFKAVSGGEGQAESGEAAFGLVSFGKLRADAVAEGMGGEPTEVEGLAGDAGIIVPEGGG